MVLYQAIFFVVLLGYGPVLLWRSLSDRTHRVGLRERTGRVPRLATDKPVVWVHGVSVGEVKAAGNFLARLRAERPDLQVVLSATTPNGHRIARQEHPGLPVVFYPLDFGPFPGRALDRIRPQCVLLMELEIWPNFLQAAARRDIPVAVINGRISERTFRGYRRARGLLPQLALIRTYCVQDDAYRQRLLDLGVDAATVHVTGNMKYDSVAMTDHRVAAAPLRAWLAPRPMHVVVAGSTHADEELWVAEAVREAAKHTRLPIRLVLVPRHPERTPAILHQLGARFGVVVRWSQQCDRMEPLPEGAVVVVDTIGQLQRFYGACDLAFVGGSLVPHGGQNMLEPSALGLPVVFGTHTFNFRSDVELLLQSRAAVQVRGAEELAQTFAMLLNDPSQRAELGARARQVIERNLGATQRTMEQVADLLRARA